MTAPRITERRRRLRTTVHNQARRAASQLAGSTPPHKRFYVRMHRFSPPRFIDGWVCHSLPSERYGEPEPVIYLLRNGHFLQPDPIAFIPYHRIYGADVMDTQELERASEKLRTLGRPLALAA